MRKQIFRMLLVSILLFILLSASAEGSGVFMINVGKADAILLFHEDRTFLVDTGKAESFGRLQAALYENNVERIDAVFITHTDKDHIGGLMPLIDAGWEIGRVYASGCSIEYEEAEHPALLAAQRLGQTITWLYAGDYAEGVFRVLAPREIYPDKEDNNSLVMMFETEFGSVLLTGDMEYPQEAGVLAAGENLKCDVLKVPNHADDDVLSLEMIRACAPKIALVSTSSYDKPETPDLQLLARLAVEDVETYFTQHSEAGIRVTMDEDGINVSYEDYADAPAIPEGISIERVEAEDDRVILKSDAPVTLTGWQLYSEKGGELFVFPKGTVINGELVIGTKTTKSGANLIWNDKNVIHNKKEDVIYLLNPYGEIVSSRVQDF